jgi:hypothetical protein
MAEAGGGSNKVMEAGVTILVAIVGVAALATLVSRSADTSNVITSFTTGFKNALCTALSPIGVSCASTSISSLIPTVTSGITYGGVVGDL